MRSTAVSVRAAQASEFDAVVAMLARAALPTRDLTPASIENFLVAAVANQLVGAVAVERHGDVGLLRSLVVASTRRNDGIGSVLVDALERRAHNEGLISLVLLTETAREFFLRIGYAVAPRSEAPKAVQQSSEFAFVCPASATYMVKALR